MLGMKQVVVLPYYLFTGTLMQHIARQVDHLRQQYPPGAVCPVFVLRV